LFPIGLDQLHAIISRTLIFEHQNFNNLCDNLWNQVSIWLREREGNKKLLKFLMGRF